MTRLAAVTPARFRNRFWNLSESFRFAAKQSLVPLTAVEIAPAAQAMPLAFVRQKDKFMLAGILSLIPGRNVYVDPAGQWLGSYVPAGFKCHPFVLAAAETDKPPVLCVDEDAGLIQDTPGEPFFDDQDQLSQSLFRILTFLNRHRQLRTQTDSLVSGLDEAGLITPWDLKIRSGTDERPVKGLYRIDEQKLNALDDDAFLGLRRSGSLPVAYAQLFSMHNLSVLQKLVQGRKPPAKKPAPPAKDLGNLFNQDDDMLSFGNI
jgi:hypothetical protein